MWPVFSKFYPCTSQCIVNTENSPGLNTDVKCLISDLCWQQLLLLNLSAPAQHMLKQYGINNNCVQASIVIVVLFIVIDICWSIYFMKLQSFFPTAEKKLRSRRLLGALYNLVNDSHIIGHCCIVCCYPNICQPMYSLGGSAEFKGDFRGSYCHWHPAVGEVFYKYYFLFMSIKLVIAVQL